MKKLGIIKWRQIANGQNEVGQCVRRATGQSSQRGVAAKNFNESLEYEISPIKLISLIINF